MEPTKPPELIYGFNKFEECKVSMPKPKVLCSCVLAINKVEIKDLHREESMVTDW